MIQRNIDFVEVALQKEVLMTASVKIQATV